MYFNVISRTYVYRLVNLTNHWKIKKIDESGRDGKRNSKQKRHSSCGEIMDEREKVKVR